MIENFDPITEGTPEEFLESVAWSDCPYYADHRLIAARDAAQRAKGFAEGRLKGLEEAAEICDMVYESDDKSLHDSMYLQGFEWGAEKCEQAIRAAAVAEIDMDSISPVGFGPIAPKGLSAEEAKQWFTAHRLERESANEARRAAAEKEGE